MSLGLIFLHNISCFKYQESTCQARQSPHCCYVKLHNTVLTYNTKNTNDTKSPLASPEVSYNMFCIHALKEYLCNKTNKCTCITCFNSCTFVVLIHRFPMCYCTKRFSTVFTSDSYPEPDKSSPFSHPICVRHILILSSHLCSGLTNGLLPSDAKCPVRLTLHFIIIIQYLLRSTTH
jgi:hypothetical protein